MATTKHWHLSLDDQPHEVALEASEWKARVKVMVDNETVVDERSSLGSDIVIEVAGRPAKIRIDKGTLNLTRNYRLIVDGAEVP